LLHHRVEWLVVVDLYLKMKRKKFVFTIEGFIILMLLVAILSLSLIVYSKNLKDSPVQKVNFFKGKITNIKTIPGNLSGIGVYDKTCKAIGNGLTECDAGIKTEKYGVLNFNYIHNMAVESCITSGDKIEIEILKDGTARIWRMK